MPPAAEPSKVSMCRNWRVVRQPGHVITMPPDDYDSWLLGHMIVELDGDSAVEAQCRELLEKVVIEID